MKSGDYDLWLDTKVKDTDRLQDLLIPYPSVEMQTHSVSRAVNNATADSEELELVS